MNIGNQSLVCGDTFVHFSQIAFVTVEALEGSQGEYDSIAVYGHNGNTLTGATYQSESSASENAEELSEALQSYYDKK